MKPKLNVDYSFRHSFDSSFILQRIVEIANELGRTNRN